MELEIFYDYRTDAWHWTVIDDTDGEWGVQSPFKTASLAVKSAEHIHPGVPWAKGVLEHYVMYFDGSRRFQAGDK